MLCAFFVDRVIHPSISPGVCRLQALRYEDMKDAAIQMIAAGQELPSGHRHRVLVLQAGVPLFAALFHHPMP